jgi:benzoyl-CoA reductase/2-hydroxyglutaryl-CoA dehydratase subunit BcrC/BadD/HgdB
LINHYTPVAIEALGDATTRTAMSQSGRFTYFQTALKEELTANYTKSYQPIVTADDYQITNVHQLVTYNQVQGSVNDEANAR